MTGEKQPSAPPTNAKVKQYNDEEDDNYYDDPQAGLLNTRTKTRPLSSSAGPLAIPSSGVYHDNPISSSWGDNPKEWQRPYWLGSSLCLILFAFWMLDSLKDPVFGDLVNGNLKRHQPIAKLVSVGTTLALVLFLEFLSSARKKRQARLKAIQQHTNDSVLDEGGTWSRIGFQGDEDPAETQNNNAESTSLVYILIAYAVMFAIISRILSYHPKYASPEVCNQDNPNKSNNDEDEDEDVVTSWHFVAYLMYSTIESFGSLAVASFWSFTNTTLSLEDAAKYYGPIIAIAQLGAVGGSTMVTTSYSDTSLILLSSLIILLHLIVMNVYTRRFRPTNIQAIVASDEDLSEVVEPFASASGAGASSSNNRRQSIQSLVSATAAQEESQSSSLWSGVHLILRHNYVLLLLGVSCLYEVSLTCLDYQMKLIGYKRFDNTMSHDGNNTGFTFTEFMGHYGQIVNATSLILSLLGFNLCISRLGLRYTLRLFPTFLLIATVVAFGALPGNLYVLFISMSMLKAMTYSIHDPSKELLYLPTSNTIKFKAKFWIDIVGARVAKAIGSTINTYAGSVDRSVSVGSMPSLLTAMLLWAACYRVGIDFDDYVASGKIVGLEGTDEMGGSFVEQSDDDIHDGIYMDDGDNQDGQDDKEEEEEDEDEGDFVSNSPEKSPAESTIELQDLQSNFKGNRRVSV